MINFIVPEVEFEVDEDSINACDAIQTSTYLHDNLNNVDIQDLLNKIVDSDVDINLNQFENINIELFEEKLGVAIIDIKEEFLKMSLLGRLGYKVVKHELRDPCKVDMSTGKRFILTLLLCCHRPSRAYGKVIRVQVLYTMNEGIRPVFLFAKILGNISEDNIVFY